MITCSGSLTWPAWRIMAVSPCVRGSGCWPGAGKAGYFLSCSLRAEKDLLELMSHCITPVWFPLISRDLQILFGWLNSTIYMLGECLEPEMRPALDQRDLGKQPHPLPPQLRKLSPYEKTTNKGQELCPTLRVIQAPAW